MLHIYDYKYEYYAVVLVERDFMTAPIVQTMLIVGFGLGVSGMLGHA